MHSSEKGHRYTNALIHEQSPYLLQHAHNPVNWMAWSEAALQLAEAENKPILLSIGYAACHWCHVMERESFEDETVAQFMNEHFINIKLDREERPDIDQIYMDALQAMTGSGGWPLNIFLFPNGKPFYGGTYFPPKSMPNRASWMEVLHAIQDAYVNKQDDLKTQANSLIGHIYNTNIVKTESLNPFSLDTLDVIMKRIYQQADLQWGGFGGAPKFPQTFCLQALLNYYFQTKDKVYLDHVAFSLQKMIQGGLYDPLQGGFARYSTDSHWQVPHFEKMLYDNALILGVLAELYQITKKDFYLNVIKQTVDFLDTVLQDATTGAYYSALDADSEGIEGKYYTWTKNELVTILTSDELQVLCNYFNITDEGNWEHTNILWSTEPIDGMFSDALNNIKSILLQHRHKRVAPAIDHKIIFSWNALMLIALTKIYAATSNSMYQQKALQLMQSLENHFIKEGVLKHVMTNQLNGHDAFLEDYALLIQSYIKLHHITCDTQWLHKAKKWMAFTTEHFSDEQDCYFYYTNKLQKDIVIRKKDMYDGAMASANATQAYNLWVLSHVFEIPEWEDRCMHMLHGIQDILVKYPSSFGQWAQLYASVQFGFIDIIGVGPTASETYHSILSGFHPHIFTHFQQNPDQEIPLLKFKQSIDNQYFICKNKTCSAPETDLNRILAKI